MEISGFLRDVIAWLVPIGICTVAWPQLRRRRGAIVAAAILCLTPALVHYDGMSSFITVWPLVLSIPAYIILLPESLLGVLYMILPIGTFIGICAWFVSGRIVVPPGNDGDKI